MSRSHLARVRRFNAFTRRKTAGMLTALLVVILGGTIGYMVIEGWSFWDSLFFTVITITTVGYGDNGISTVGERFTLLVMAGGIGVVTYSFTQLAPVFFDQKRIQERRMYKRIMQLSDHHIVCGLGRIGRTVCAMLAETETPFVAIDRSEEAVRWAIAEGYLAVRGDATADDVLDEVNVHTARTLACVAKVDTDNIVITLSARALNPDVFIIARAEQGDSGHKLEQAGASLVISPTCAGGRSIVQAIHHPELVPFFEHSARKTVNTFGLVEIKVSPDSLLNGMSSGDFHGEFPDTTLVAVQSNGRIPRMNPSPSTVLSTNDVLIVAGLPADLAQLDATQRGRRSAA